MRNSKTSQLIINAIQAGTRFSYSHTMSNNRTIIHHVTFAGTPTKHSMQEANEVLRYSTNESLFVPEQVGLISLRNDLAIGDEVWHTIEGGPLTEVIGYPADAPHIDEFIEKFANADWAVDASASYCALISQHELEKFAH